VLVGAPDYLREPKGKKERTLGKIVVVGNGGGGGNRSGGGKKGGTDRGILLNESQI